MDQNEEIEINLALSGFHGDQTQKFAYNFINKRKQIMDKLNDQE